MSQTVRGVIARQKGEPVELVNIVVPDPGPGEAVVDVTACGVCHTDLTYREGGINDEYPFLLGHEAAGIIEAVGPGVTAVEPGDFVILNWRAVCGQCRACKRGRPRYCFDTFNAEQKMTLTDGTELTAALGIGAFADKTLVHSGQCTKVDPAADPAVAGLLGCGVMAGLGAAINTGGVTRDDTVAVIGCGGVGDAAIAGAALVGAKRIIAVDTDDTKLDWARTFGATHTVNAREVDVVQAIGGLTDGFARGRGDRRRRPTGNLPAGLLRPRSRRNRCAGGCSDARHAPGHAAGRLLLSRRCAEVVVVRRLPARKRLPHADRPLPAGPAAAAAVRFRTHRARRRRGGVPQDAWRQGIAFGGDVVMAAIERVITHGTFELDGGSWEVDNNIWLVGDDSEVVVFDAAHHAAPIIDAVGGRKVVAVICTHGHNDHVTVAPELGTALDAPVLMHPGDAVLWRMTHPDKSFRAVSDGDAVRVGGTELRALHTPGHSPGSVCWYAPELGPGTGTVFSGDTLFAGGPGATGRSYSDFPTILRSISGRLGALPGDTVVHTGHGDSTTIGDEIVHYEEWVARGH